MDAAVVFSQESRFMLDISDVLSKQKFEEIMKFILTNGDRQTYCQMYNNNPHYAFENFDVYLNPIHQRINWLSDNLSYTVSDYDEIVIDSRYNYYFLRLVDAKIYIYNVYQLEPQTYYEKELLEIYIPKLKSLVN
jgi:hypothetical protein